MINLLFFSSIEYEYNKSDNKVIYKKICIPKNKIELIEEVDDKTSKINGKLVYHSFKEAISIIKGIKNKNI